MTLADHLLKQIDHNFWANRLLGEALIRQNAATDKNFNWFCHIMGSEATWLSRCTHTDSPYAIWPQIDPSEWAGIEVDHHQSLSALVMDNADALDRVIAYKNSRGEARESPMNEILQHLFLHGQYHRGQINSHLREAGLEPVTVDYIMYQWQGYKELGALMDKV